MSRATDNYVEGTDLFLGLTRLRVDAKVAIKVNISKIQPGDSGTAGNSRSNLPAWLAASKAALAASQADHQETQRRISKLQEGLSVIDFPEHNGNDAAQVSASGCDVGKDGCAAGGEGLAPEEKPRGDLHQLHRITPGVVAEVVSFLEPQAVLSYALACKAAEDALWQDECWGGIFRVRHLKAVVGPPAALQLPSASSQTDGKLRDVAVLEDSDEPIQSRGLGVLTDAPLRKAVIAHARSLSRALCLFDVAVSNGGTTKAVVNGPARTAAAVASLRALVEITANVSDPVGRRPFADVRTGQMLLSIITRQHGSAVLQDLACAVLGNLFCDPEASAGAELAGQAAEFSLLGGSAADKLLGRSKRSAIQALTALCSSTQPSPSSWSAPKLSGGGMRPVENLPGRQASRALINLLLPRYQVSQQPVTMRNNVGDVDNCPRQPSVRRCSLPLMPSPARQQPQQLQGEALERSRDESVPAPAKAGKGGSGVGGAQSASLAWEEVTVEGDDKLSGGGGERRRREEGAGGREKENGRAADGRTSLPMVAAPAAGGGLVQLLRVAPRKEATAMATPMPDDSASASSQAVPKAAGQPPRQPATAAATPPASRPTRTMEETAEPSLLAVPSPTRQPIPETSEASSTRQAPSAMASIDRKPHPMPPYKHTPQQSGSLKSAATPTARLVERANHCGDCDPYDVERSKLVDSLSTPWVHERGECSAGGGQQLEEVWEAFYFYNSGGVKDTFLVTSRFSTTSGGSIFGRGTDKLGNFVMEGAPLLGNAAGDTWFVTKTYTGSGGVWSGGAHVTHTAYLTDGLAHDHRPVESNMAPSLNMSNTRLTGRHDGFWGVWEPVLGRAGGGGGGGRRASSSSVDSVVPDGGRTTLSRRGGVFRLVPKQQGA